MKPQLSKAHQSTYDSIFRHPIARDLHWRDVRSMLGELGEVGDQPNGHFKVTANGESLLLYPAGDTTLADADVLMSIRHFLKTSPPMPPPPPPPPPPHPAA